MDNTEFLLLANRYNQEIDGGAIFVLRSRKLCGVVLGRCGGVKREKRFELSTTGKNQAVEWKKINIRGAKWLKRVYVAVL